MSAIIEVAKLVAPVVADTSKFGSELDGATQKARGWASGIGKTVGKFAMGAVAGGALAATGAVTALGAGIIKMTMDASAVQGVANTFDNLVQSIGGDAVTAMEQLRAATRGMVADADLMQAGNKFFAMGLANTTEEAARLSEIATQLGSAMGEDATASMENFALMLANQSIPRLDSFGISSGAVRTRIEELMAATEGLTREEAFMQAVMEQAEVTMAKVGEQSDTTAASMSRIKSTMANTALGIGQAFLPALQSILSPIANIAEQVGPKLVEWAQQAGAWLGERLPGMIEKAQTFLTDKLMPAISQTAAWLSEKVPAAVDKVRTFWNEKLLPTLAKLKEVYDTTIKPALDELKAAFGELWGALKEAWNSLKPVFKEIKDAFAEAFGIKGEGGASVVKIAVGVIVVAIKVLAKVITAVAKVIQVVVKGITKFWEAHGEKIKAVIFSIAAVLKTVVALVTKLIKGDFKGAWEEAKKLVKAYTDMIIAIVRLAFDMIMSIIRTVMDAIIKLLDAAWESIKRLIDAALNAIKQLIQNAWNAIKSIIESAMDAIKRIIDTTWAAIKRIIESAMDAIKRIIDTAWTAIKNTIDAAMTAIKNIIETAWTAIKNTIDAAMTAIKNIIETAWNSIKNTIDTVLDSIISAVKTAWDNIKSDIESAMNSIKDMVTNLWNTIKDNITRVLGEIKTAVEQKFQEIYDAVKAKLEQLADIPNQIADKLRSIGTEIMAKILEGIQAAADFVEKVKTQLATWFDKLRESIWFSFMAGLEVGKMLVQKIIDGITSVITFVGDVIDTIKGWMGDVVSRASEWVDSVKEIGAKIVANIKQGIIDAWDSFVAWVVGKINGIFDNMPWNNRNSAANYTPSLSGANVGGLGRMAAAGAGAGGTLSIGGNTYNVTINTPLDLEEFYYRVEEAQRRARG